MCESQFTRHRTPLESIYAKVIVRRPLACPISELNYNTDWGDWCSIVLAVRDFHSRICCKTLLLLAHVRALRSTRYDITNIDVEGREVKCVPTTLTRQPPALMHMQCDVQHLRQIMQFTVRLVLPCPHFL